MCKILVAYFSAEGTTAKVARQLADAVGAELFEITPKEPYTAADIKWTNPLARCNREKLGKKDVPIAKTVQNMADYDLVLIGFPIWYYCAPNIVHTFVKEHDFTGKKIGLFATSGGSGMGKTAEKMKPCLNGNGEIVDAKLFPATVSMGELQNWVENELRKPLEDGEQRSS